MPRDDSGAGPSAAGPGSSTATGPRQAEDEDDEVQSMQFKLILLGDGAVGKTSIAMRFSQDSFAQQYKQTVGVDFFMRKLVFPKKEVALQMWDIGGQSIGSKMVGSYIGGAQAVLLCYDITNYESFANLEDWLRLVLRAFPTDKARPLIALVGNKTDLRHLTAVRTDQHQKFCDDHGLVSFFISAKTADNVTSCFNKVAATLAGVVLSKAETEAQTVVVATIIDHKRHDPEVNAGAVPSFQRKDRNCILS